VAVKVLGWVWDHSRAEGAARLVLLAIADCTNASGNDAWPSMTELCRKTLLSERGVQKAIRRLEEMGELKVTNNAGRGRTNRYQVVMETPHPVRGLEAENPEPRSPRTEFAPEQSSPKTPNVVRETPNHVHPEPEEPTTRTVTTTAPPVTPPRASDRGTRLPDGFAVTPEMAAWAREKAPSCGPTDHEAFCDYWHSVPGAKGRKRDWEATWRNWMRREHERRSRSSRATPNGRRVTADDRLADIQALKLNPPAGPTATARPLNLIQGELA
jgi:helix-turn-helix protein